MEMSELRNYVSSDVNPDIRETETWNYLSVSQTQKNIKVLQTTTTWKPVQKSSKSADEGIQLFPASLSLLFF